MSDASPFIGRARETAELEAALMSTGAGRGGLLLLAGEAGVGKTRLATEVLSRSGLLILPISLQEVTPPYAPVAAALRAYLRIAPTGLSDYGPLSAYLPLLLPELGPIPTGGDRATLVEAVCGALEAIARRQPTVVFLDDLQWADNATLELLSALVGSLHQCPLLVLGAYRSDEIPRGHPVRRLRAELRRKGQLREITVEPLNPDETATLAAQVLGAAPDASLAATLYDRTQGLPFFVEELTAALVASAGVQIMNRGAELTSGDLLPVPPTIRDAVLLRVERLSPEARQLLEVSAVAGTQFDLDLVSELAGSEAGWTAALASGLVIESDAGQGAFRHALTREAVYGELPWPRRRGLHREIAASLEKQNAPLSVVAEHWQMGRDFTRARNALAQLAERSCAVHAYRDAAHAARRALELWPEGEEESRRLDVLDRLGSCAQLNGDLAEAARAWREVAEQRRQAADGPRFADTQRRLASVYELQANWEAALAARSAAADAFAQSHLPGEAAAERLAVAAHLHGAGRFTSALEFVTASLADAERADRLDLQARGRALQGAVLAKLSRFEEGREAVRAGLALALENNLIGPAAEAYQRLASAYEQAGDLAAARDAYQTAFEYCQAKSVSVFAQFCLACLAVVLRDTGEWDRLITVCKEVLNSPETNAPTRAIATGLLGLVYAYRGQTKQARSSLQESFDLTQRFEMGLMMIWTVWGLGHLHEVVGDTDSATERCRFLLIHCQQIEDRHYAVPALWWAATFFASHGLAADARGCAHALAAIASSSGTPEALAALAHALGETALLDGNAKLATEQFHQALTILGELDLPYERAVAQWRAGVALVASGERALGIERLVEAYRIAAKLKAKPLAERAASELAALGEKVEKRLGRKAARGLEGGGLTPREREVLRRVALGRTNREIAQELFLSPRTVDMFVRNILNKLNCSSRLEASRKAEELGLLA